MVRPNLRDTINGSSEYLNIVHISPHTIDLYGNFVTYKTQVYVTFTT